jgi:hypothetical protein
MLAAAILGATGMSPVYADAGCPHLGKTAGKYFDEAKLCAACSRRRGTG